MVTATKPGENDSRIAHSPRHGRLGCFISIAAAVAVVLLFTACGGRSADRGGGAGGHTTDHGSEAYWKTAEWPDVLSAAKGSEVSFYMWGGSATINQWIDGVVAPLMKERYGVTLRRVPMDAPVFVNRLMAEREAGRSRGSIDLMWINGENFKRAREADLLAGPFAARLPNVQRSVDPQSAAYDFGFPTEGYSAPYGRAQFVFEYDSAASYGRPNSFAELPDWVRRNPGRFTYPEPSDFTGSAFIRQAFLALNGGPARFLDGWDETQYKEASSVLWQYLNDIAPYLWQEGRSYPRDLAMLDTLFERGEVAINMSYTQANAQARILEGRYPPSVRSFVMEEGSLFNTHFTAIAFNAPNPEGALLLANLLLDPAVQASKNDPANWGDFPALDVRRLKPTERKLFEAIDLGEATLSLTELEAAAIPEIPAEYLEALQEDWYRFVP